MTKPLVFTVPKLADRPQIFMVSEKLDPDRMFFNVRVEPEIPVKVERAAVKRVGLFYDASGSAEQRDRKRENAFLAKWLKTLGNVKVDLVAFRNDADQAVTFDIKNGDASELIKAIESLPIDGGTSLGAVDVSSTPEADTVLLMSDVKGYNGKTAAWQTLIDTTYIQRTWGDSYGYLLVATGRAEIMVDPVMAVWDCGPLQVIMEEAGGTFTDWKGIPTIYGGESVATNGALFDQVMALINSPGE